MAGPMEQYNQQQQRSQSRASNHHFYTQQQQQTPQPSQPSQPSQPAMPPHQYVMASQVESVADSSEEVSRYFPTPSPRKPSHHHQQQQTPQPQTAYQNLPDNAVVRHMNNGGGKQRLVTVTPNRLSERDGGSRDDAATGEFRRSASARLHRNKKNYPAEALEMVEASADYNGGSMRKKEQREESMKRLLEWKQRMLQSPLTRKSSRNASRTQTPTNSDSPVPSLTENQIFRMKVLEELELQEGRTISEGAGTPGSAARRLSRKGSGASRSSRSRSSPRFVNRQTTSSSDEGRIQFNLNRSNC
jgi:hypothetical protein